MDPILTLTLNATPPPTRQAVTKLASCLSILTGTDASVNDLRPEMGVARPRAAPPSLTFTAMSDLCSGPYPNPNPKRDLTSHQAGRGEAGVMSVSLNRH